MDADLGNASPFANFAARCVERTLDMYLETIEEPEILTLTEASKLTPHSQEYKFTCPKGALGAFKQGRKWVVTKIDLDRCLRTTRKRTKQVTKKH